jgi:hypothetical protein
LFADEHRGDCERGDRKATNHLKKIGSTLAKALVAAKKRE